MSQAGCYTLDLYCDAAECIRVRLLRAENKNPDFPHQFVAERGEDCRRQARRFGWKIARLGSPGDLCPACNKRRRHG